MKFAYAAATSCLAMAFILGCSPAHAPAEPDAADAAGESGADSTETASSQSAAGGAASGGAEAAPGLPPGHPPIGDAGALPGLSSGGASDFTWTAPEGWTDAGARPMREVTFTLDGVEGAECYVTVLAGEGGGIASNINRWLGQVGAAPLSEPELAELPTVSMMGQDAPLIEAEGTFTGMDGSTQEDAALLGGICLLEDEAVFVKMTGPRDAVLAQRDNFVAFCESIEPAA